MKRSGREGRRAELPPVRTRFAAEAAFLILVAVGAALARLSPLSIIGIMLLAWLLVALIERASAREQTKAVAGVDQTDVMAMPAEEPPEAEVEEPEPLEEPEPAGRPRRQVALRWIFWRREHAALDPLVAPTAGLEERPSRTHVRRIEATPSPEVIELEAVVAEIVVEEIPAPAPGPSVTKRPLDLPGLEEPEPAGAAAPPPAEASPAVEAPPVEAPPEPPEPPVVEPPVVEPPVVAPPVGAPPAPPPVERAPPPPPPEPPRTPPGPPPPAREWNIWDLERRAREQSGDPMRDEEWAALFMHLRQYANADGVLPLQFDDLVRESFSELIQAA